MRLCVESEGCTGRIKSARTRTVSDNICTKLIMRHFKISFTPYGPGIGPKADIMFFLLVDCVALSCCQSPVARRPPYVYHHQALGRNDSSKQGANGFWGETTAIPAMTARKGNTIY